MILINGIPASKELVTIFSMVKGSTLENPVKTKDLKNATGLSERMIRDGINNLRFTYSVPIQSQLREESRLINKLVDNFLTWNENEEE